jgi:cytochrome c peroxidase
VIGFTPGRTDATTGGENCPPEDRLPVADESPTGIREIFGGRFGLTDREFVAIMGAHSVGRAHPEFSGFPNRHWDTTPQVLDNLYYGLLREPPAGVEWQEDFAVNPETGEEMRFFRSYSWLMLPVDMLLREDPLFRPIMEEYARFENLEAWRQDFGAALRKVTELGLEYNSGPEGGVRPRVGTAVPCPTWAGPAGLLRGGDGGCPFMTLKATDGGSKQHKGKPAGHP